MHTSNSNNSTGASGNTGRQSNNLSKGVAPSDRAPIEIRNDAGDEHSGSSADERARANRQLAKRVIHTPVLDSYSRDLTAIAKAGEVDPVIGRSNEIERVLEILLRRGKNNPVLVGEAGVGKTAVVEGLAQMIARDEIPGFEGKRVVALDVTALVAGTQYRGQFEERIQAIIKEVEKAGNIIIFIDEIHTLVGAGASSGAMDATNILKPALARGKFQTIGATTFDEYRKHIEKDPALDRRFQRVTVLEPSIKDTIAIVRGVLPKYASHHKVKIPAEIVDQAVTLAARYLTDRRFPDKAIDIIDEAASRVRVAKGTEVTSDVLCAVIAQMSGVPVGVVSADEAKKLLGLETKVSQAVIGQEEAVAALCSAIRRDRAGLRDPKRPAGSFLLVGPTGTGKTHLMKVLAQELYGSKEDLIQFDMSEYMERHSVSRLIGAPPGYVGYESEGQLVQAIRRNPHCIILLDEIEKAHEDIQLILLQILEEGRLTDSHGREVNCKNVVFAMTSNLGSEEARKGAFGLARRVDKPEADYQAQKRVVLAAVEQHFRPELLGRMDGIIVFRPLSREDVAKIARIEIADLQQRVATKGYTLEVAPDVMELVVERGYDKDFGARPLRRSIRTIIEDSFVEAELSGDIKPGQDVLAVLRDNRVEFVPLPQIRRPALGAESAAQGVDGQSQLPP